MLTFIKNIFIADSRVSDHVESESGVKKKTQLRGDFRSGEFFFTNTDINAKHIRPDSL